MGSLGITIEVREEHYSKFILTWFGDDFCVVMVLAVVFEPSQRIDYGHCERVDAPHFQTAFCHQHYFQVEHEAPGLTPSLVYDGRLAIELWITNVSNASYNRNAQPLFHNEASSEENSSRLPVHFPFSHSLISHIQVFSSILHMMNKTRSSSPSSSRHHLLTSSRPSSILTTNTDATLTNRKSQDTIRALPVEPYRGFPSKEAYLTALRQFADSKKYYEMDSQLVGFYGTKTTEDILKEEGGWRTKTKAQRQAEKEKKMRDSEQGRASLATVAEEGGQLVEDQREGRGMRRLSRGIERVFTRRGTVG